MSKKLTAAQKAAALVALIEEQASPRACAAPGCRYFTTRSDGFCAIHKSRADYAYARAATRPAEEGPTPYDPVDHADREGQPRP